MLDFDPIHFTAVVEESQNNLGWWIAVLPFESETKFGTKKGFNVRATVGGRSFPTTLFPTGDGRHYLMITNDMKKAGELFPGRMADFELENDPLPREVLVPDAIMDVLEQRPELQQIFEKLAPSHRKYFVGAWQQAKAPETKLKRIAFMLEKLEEIRLKKASKQ